MMNLHYLSRLTIVQLTLMVGFILALLSQVWLPEKYTGHTSTASTNEQQVAEVQLPSLTQTELQQLEDFSTISERPLFHSSRAPEEVVTVLSATQSPKRSPQQDWILTGIVLNGSDKIALFNAIGKKKTSSLRNGMKLGEWTLDEITPESVTFSKQGQSIEMLLIKESAVQTRPGSTSSSLFRSQSQYNKVVRPME